MSDHHRSSSSQPRDTKGMPTALQGGAGCLEICLGSQALLPSLLIVVLSPWRSLGKTELLPALRLTCQSRKRTLQPPVHPKSCSAQRLCCHSGLHSTLNTAWRSLGSPCSGSAWLLLPFTQLCPSKTGTACWHPLPMTLWISTPGK